MNINLDLNPANNFKIIVIAIAVICWFRGMYRMLDEFVDNTMMNNIVLVIFSLLMLFIIDGDLGALGKDNKEASYPNTSKNINRNANRNANRNVKNTK
jgi:hypothetical protein